MIFYWCYVFIVWIILGIITNHLEHYDDEHVCLHRLNHLLFDEGVKRVRFYLRFFKVSHKIIISILIYHHSFCWFGLFGCYQNLILRDLYIFMLVVLFIFIDSFCQGDIHCRFVWVIISWNLDHIQITTLNQLVEFFCYCHG